MKKIILLIVALSVVMGVKAQSRQSIYALAGFEHSIDGGYEKYWSVNAGAMYQLYFWKGFSFMPQANIHYMNHDGESGSLLSLAPQVGFTFLRLTVYTGPQVNFKLLYENSTRHLCWGMPNQEAKVIGDRNWVNTVSAFWKIGLALNFDPIWVSAYYSPKLSNLPINTFNNVSQAGVTIGWRFRL